MFALWHIFTEIHMQEIFTQIYMEGNFKITCLSENV
jgi:hypothetical protein